MDLAEEHAFEDGMQFGSDGFQDEDAVQHDEEDQLVNELDNLDTLTSGNKPVSSFGLTDEDLQFTTPQSSSVQPTLSEELPDVAQETEVESAVEGEDVQPSTSKPDMRTIFGSDDESDNEDNVDKPAEESNIVEGQAEQQQTQPDPTQPAAAEEDNKSEASIHSDDAPEKLSDFDIMMAQKSEERRRAYSRRKRRDGDLINDHDDAIKAMIEEMKEAAEADRRANQRGECAISKLTMLARIMNLLRKQDLQTAMLEMGILSALADWLAPLPDGNLPHLKIRESILKVLQEMSAVTPEGLKNSGIGKAVMLLFKHPREMKENRTAAGKLIQEWSRPIFGTSANYRSLSREDREERDMELLKIKRRQSLDGSGRKKRTAAAAEDDKEEEEGDSNAMIPRARVPQPSLKDYVIRPKSSINNNVEANEGGRRSTGTTKPQNRFVKKMRGLQEQQRAASGNKNKRLSVEGRQMM